MTDFQKLMEVLSAKKVEFIIVGGFAGTLHGSAIPTRDLDIVYQRDRTNIDRLVEALAPYSPYLRGAPPGLPFAWDRGTIQSGLNFTLTTTMGAIDLFGEIPGGGGFDQLSDHVIDVNVFGHRVRCLDLDTLISVKRAAGRVKDLVAIADLEALREEQHDRE